MLEEIEKLGISVDGHVDVGRHGAATSTNIGDLKGMFCLLPCCTLET